MFLQKVDGSYNVESVNGKLVFMVKDVHVETPWINMEVSGTVSDLKNVPLFDLQLKTNDVMLDDSMMGNVFNTQFSEASGFFSLSADWTCQI